MKNIIYSLLCVLSISLYAQKKSRTDLEKAHLQIGLQDFKGAIHTYTEILLKDSSNQEALIGRAEAKLLVSDYFGAIQDLSVAIKFKPTSRAYLLRGKTKNNLLDYRGAIGDFNRGLEYDKENEVLLLERAKSQLALKSYEESVLDFTKLIELNPSNKDAFYLRGLIKIHQGKKEEGCLDLSHAGELGDEDAYKKIAELCVP